MAFFKADDKKLACDAWPGEIGRVLLERGKKIFPRHKLVPCELEEIPTWLCVETDPDRGKALVMFRTDVVSDEDGEAVPVTIRILGILTAMDLSVDGDWDGTAENIFKAHQYVTLTSGGCGSAFGPQENAIANIRKVVLTMLGKTSMGNYGRPGTITLRKRIFTKIKTSEVDDTAKVSVVEPSEDPTGRIRKYEDSWRILEKIRCGRQDADGTLRPMHPSLLQEGDFVDVLATLSVPLTRGRVGLSGDLMVEPVRVIRLRTVTQVAPLLRIPAVAKASAPKAHPVPRITVQDELDVSMETGSTTRGITGSSMGLEGSSEDGSSTGSSQTYLQNVHDDQPQGMQDVQFSTGK